ncbi:MAG: SIMPL domain-containing protein [Bacteroidetes bacterium]|nr:SIMPL domain-containing protein [Bacteroidota bacterium]
MKKLLIFVVLILPLVSFVQAQEKPYIAVTGESVVKVMPDYAIVKVRVEANAKAASEAKKKHDISVDAVLKLLKKMKFDSKEIATQYMHLNKTYDYNTKEYNYVATQSIHITLKDFNKYEALLQGLFESGVNSIDGIQFATTEFEKHKVSARKLAIQQAKQKAIEYAGELNQAVGKAIVISEFENINVPRFDQKMALEEVVVSGYRETIAIGEILVTAKVNVTFELK